MSYQGRTLDVRDHDRGRWEPSHHGVDFSEEGARLFVTDDGGRRLIELDPVELVQVGEVALPGSGHDSVATDCGIWTTLVGRDDLAFIAESTVDMFPTGSSPHDLFVDTTGLIWFSYWVQPASMFSTPRATTTAAPAGVSEPYHFGMDADGRVWVSDNGGDSVVAYTPGRPVATIVGPTPHHLAG